MSRKAIGYEIRAKGTSAPVRLHADGALRFGAASTLFPDRASAVAAKDAFLASGATRQHYPRVVPVYPSPLALPRAVKENHDARP